MFFSSIQPFIVWPVVIMIAGSCSVGYDCATYSPWYSASLTWILASMSLSGGRARPRR